jgi:hypothetical protein
MLRTIDRQFTLVVIAIFLIGTATIFAQSNPQPDQPAPVLLDGRTVFYVRTAVKQLTAERGQRALPTVCKDLQRIVPLTLTIAVG